jgi:hypothetical protein
MGVTVVARARKRLTIGVRRYGQEQFHRQRESWTHLTLPGITVSNGRCEVGVTTSGRTVTIGDFVPSQG